MCTSLSLKTNDFYFGRNMDIDYGFGEKIIITPRNYPIKFKKANDIDNHFAIIGMAANADNYPLYAEAANEKGLCMAGLNFPDNAYYSPCLDREKHNISPFEIILWVLSQCENIIDAKKLLNKTHLTAIPFNDSIPLATLHWHIADQNHSIVVECTKSGMQIYDNPLHVLTNNPDFHFHITNLGQYLNLKTNPVHNCFYDKANIKDFGKGSGSIGLPGDFSSASRFVKAAYLRLNSICSDDENASISQFFHLLDSVAVVHGGITDDDVKEYMTTYSCCINASKGIYYYKTYENNQLTAINMNHENLVKRSLIEFAVSKGQQIKMLN